MAAGPIHCGAFFLFAAFVLLLVATISSPVVDKISFLNVQNGAVEATFGTFGYCQNIHASNSGCSSSKLGYNIIGVSGAVTDLRYVNDTLEHVTKGLILHPIAMALSFLALLVAVCSDRLGFIFASFITFLAFIASLAAMIVDFVLFGIIRHEVNDNTTGSASFSSAIWLVLAATVVLFFSTFIVFFSCCTHRRRSRDEDRPYHSGYAGPGPQMGYAPTKRHWWSRSAKY